MCSAAADAVVRVGKLADCRLVAADGSSFEVFQAALAIHSKIRSMFTDLDAAESSVRLDDSAAEISSLVDYCYGGDQFMVNNDNLLSCSRVAHKYDMPGLQRAVEAFVKQLELTEDNVLDCIVDAHGHPSLDKLRERWVNYAAVHLQRLLILRKDDEQPTDWLEALPQSTLVDLMQRRCRLLVSLAHAGPTAAFEWLTDDEMAQLESRLVVHDKQYRSDYVE